MEFTRGRTLRPASFGRIEADKPYVRFCLIDANGVAIDHRNLMGLDRVG
jgi:hypothetical protein